MILFKAIKGCILVWPPPAPALAVLAMLDASVVLVEGPPELTQAPLVWLA
jgi:hypothetical protein